MPSSRTTAGNMKRTLRFNNQHMISSMAPSINSHSSVLASSERNYVDYMERKESKEFAFSGRNIRNALLHIASKIFYCIYYIVIYIHSIYITYITSIILKTGY